MSELSNRMREIANKATVAPSQGPEVCTMRGAEFDDQPKYWRCALGDGVLSLCAEIEDLEEKLAAMHRRAQEAESLAPCWKSLPALGMIRGDKGRAVLAHGLVAAGEENEALRRALAKANNYPIELVSREMLKAVSRALVDTGIVEGIVIEPMTLIDVVGFVCDGIKKIETELAYERDARRLRVKQTSFAHGGHPEGWSVYNEADRRLSRSGDWDYQPLPSSRSAEWIAEHSWPTMRAAVDAARKAEAK